MPQKQKNSNIARAHAPSDSDVDPEPEWHSIGETLFFTLINPAILVRDAFQLFLRSLTFLLGLYVLFGLLSFATNSLVSYFADGSHAFCRLPGISAFCPPWGMRSNGTHYIYLNGSAPNPALPIPRFSNVIVNAIVPEPVDPSLSPPDFPFLASVQAPFAVAAAQSLVTAAAGRGLERRRVYLWDLASAVKFSGLDCAPFLEFRIRNFDREIGNIARLLVRFQSRVSLAITLATYTNDWSMLYLNEAQAMIDAANSEPKTIFGRLFAPLVRYRTGIIVRRYVTEAFHMACRRYEVHFRRLAEEARVLLQRMDYLDDLFILISEAAVSENLKVSEGGDTILSELWAMVGGRDTRKQRKNHQLIFKDILAFRNITFNKVASIYMMALNMHTSMQELQGKVNDQTAQMGIGSKGREIPLEMQINAMRHGAQLLQKLQVKVDEKYKEDTHENKKPDPAQDKSLILAAPVETEAAVWWRTTGRAMAPGELAVFSVANTQTPEGIDPPS